MPAVEVSGLTVRYATSPVPAVDGIDLVAEAGEVLVVLGPNGAGKTSTVETLEGYRRAAGGTVRVLGLDPGVQHRALSGRIGVMLQRGGVYPMLGPRRVLNLFADYYPDPAPAEDLLDLVGLRAVATTPWRHLSGGEQQRLSLALALVGRPEVAFLDEPTAGVDPEGRLTIRDVVAGLKEQGVCVVLTTHELAEAERLADRVVILVAGRVAREGTPAALAAAAVGPPAIVFGAPAGLDTAGLADAVGPGTSVAEPEPGRYRVEGPTAAGPAATAAVATWLAGRGITLTDLATGRTLEDVYFDVVGAAAREPAGEAEAEPHLGAAPAQARSPMSVRPLGAQTGAEVYMTLRRGETLLLTLGIPVIFLLFFSKVSVISTPTATPVDFFMPGILSLAVMSTAMVSLGIATGFERGYGVLKRLGTTPLGRPRLLGAKIITIVAVELIQAAVLVPVGVGLGWDPGRSGVAAVPGAIGAILLGSAAFAGIGLLMAGTLRAEVNLAAANGLYLVLLLLGGMIVPISKLPSGLESFAKLLPAEALSAALHATLGAGGTVPAESWFVLLIWAVAAPLVAALTFRWE